MSGMRDLSHPIATGMQVYPGDPRVSVEPALLLARDGVDVAALHLGSHTGTHLDAPSHCIEGGRTTARITLGELIGDGLIVHLQALAPRATYGLPEIEAVLDGGLPDQLPPIVVFDTGWATHVGSESALDHPVLSVDAATLLVRRGMRVLAVDTLSPDPTGAGADFPVHQVVLGADALIVENLCNLEGLPAGVRIGFFPLPIDADGAPVRAVAFEPISGAG
jgi:kynurenine formamidase